MAIDTTSEIKAIARYIRTSPFKVRRVLDQIRGKSYQEALILLEFMPYRACEPIVKVLRSAVANAEHNAGLDKAKLVVSQAYADQGPVLKRFRPPRSRSCLPNPQANLSHYRSSGSDRRKLTRENVIGNKQLKVEKNR
jgi:large subunit ribosomal protein L22